MMENKNTENVSNEARAAASQYWREYRQLPHVKNRQREYMREYMRRYRAKKKEERAAQSVKE